MNTEQITAREIARTDTGQFGEQEHTAPEVALAGPSLKALGMVGAGPHSPNTFAEPADSEEDRPARPYFALTPGDDDEVFDAPIGTRVHVKDGNRLRRFVRVHDARTTDPMWDELSEHREAPVSQVTAGQVWEAMFADDGTMHSSLLHAPKGMLYSDRGWYQHRSLVDKPLTTEQALDRLRGTHTATMLSRSAFGDSRDDGILDPFKGKVTIACDDEGYVKITPADARRTESRGITLDRMEVFEREGAIVFRRETDPGWGWEETYRIDGKHTP